MYLFELVPRPVSHLPYTGTIILDGTVGSLLSPERILRGTWSSKPEAINTLLGSLRNVDAVTDHEEVARAVWAREALLTTAVGLGLALPHAKTDAILEPVGALMLMNQPVDFDADDGQLVDTVFLLVGPVAARRDHIRSLSMISILMSNIELRASLKESKSVSAVLELLNQAENGLRLGR